MRINEVQAEPGGNVTITFVPHGYEVQGVHMSTRMENWYERFFRFRYVLSALIGSVAFGVLAILAGEQGASSTTQTLIFAPGIVGIAYALLSFAASRLTLLTSAAQTLRMADYKHHPSHTIYQAWAHQSPGALTVTVQHTDGTQVRYTATGPTAPTLGQGFHHLLGPRLTSY
ncbi:hypothetical protein [Actinocorallia populi]|uniref:hypothetical protein n=1 Tax=Actinocorallia populi TaxID=2079200 RepID=UPI000D088A32|nr:hypothetical protein [Actinocorallia populi]